MLDELKSMYQNQIHGKPIKYRFNTNGDIVLMDAILLWELDGHVVVFKPLDTPEDIKLGLREAGFSNSEILRKVYDVDFCYASIDVNKGIISVGSTIVTEELQFLADIKSGASINLDDCHPTPSGNNPSCPYGW